jgi:sugar-specific transcriptional regulator TrmB
MKNTILESLGLDKHEKEIYTYLLKNGVSSPTQIENGSQTHRPIVYKSLESLMDKGLVTKSSKGKRHQFLAESPEKLEGLFKNLENNYLSEIEDLYSYYEVGKSEKPEVVYSKGFKAIQNSYSDIVNTLKKDGKYYRYASTTASNREKYLPVDYREKRDKKGLERLIITNKKSSKENVRLGSRVKTLPDELDFLDDNFGQIIYGNKVAIIDYESQFVTTIESKKYAKFQEKIFMALFEKL